MNDSAAAPPYAISVPAGPVVACALHASHDMRPSLASRCLLDDATRRREEDPHTEVIADVGAGLVRVHRSRFEVDLNRPRHLAVYRTPDDAWGLEVWDGGLPESEAAASVAIYDAFYEDMGVLLDGMVAAHGGAVVLDVHSYNHRRRGPHAPDDPAVANPEINLGTGTLDRDLWDALASRTVAHLSVSGFDVRENVRFRGGHFAAWAHERYAGAVCVLAFEFKKVFMDEWTGMADAVAVERARHALAGCVPYAEHEARRQR